MLTIADYVAEITSAHGGVVSQGDHWTNAMERAGIKLAEACGMDAIKASALRMHELTALYTVARKNPASARALAGKLGGVPAIPTPATPEPAPLPVPSAPAIDMGAVELAAEQAALGIAKLAMGDLPELVRQALEKIAPRRIEIVQPNGETIKIETAHEAFEEVLDYCDARLWPYLVGPAGSGKTTIAENVATALGMPFYMAAKVQSEFALLGYMNAAGNYVRTPFREAYENGGVFLFDEMDGSSASALVALNAGLANGHCPFPDGLIKRHPDFICIGAGNTYGKGKDRQYVGRTQIDDATIDRFAFIEIDYDDKLERAIASNQAWVNYIQAIRADVTSRNIRHIVSPRASIAGSKMLARGRSWASVAKALLWKGLDPETVRQISNAVPMWNYEVN